MVIDPYRYNFKNIYFKIFLTNTSLFSCPRMLYYCNNHIVPNCPSVCSLHKEYIVSKTAKIREIDG